MKQYLIIVIALVIIIFLNIWQTNYLKNTGRYLLSDINEIDNSVKREDYESALKGMAELEKTWQKIKNTWDIFGEHNDIEEINERIESMKVYAKYRDTEEVVNEYTLLQNLIEHIIESEQLNFGNVL